MNLFHTLKHAADLEQLRLNPLPDHAFSQAEEHLRRQYGQVLAAVLSAQDAVSESQSRLLLLLLESLKVGDARAAFFQAVREWDEAALTEALRLLREAKAADPLLVDALVLLRIEAPIPEPMAQLVTEMARFLGVTETDLRFLADHAKTVLGLDGVDAAEAAVSLAHWPSHAPRLLTADDLAAGITGGFWRVDRPLVVHAEWSAKDAVFVFEQGAHIATTLPANAAIGLEGCQFIRPVLTYTGTGTLTVTRCRFEGDYAVETPTIALKTVGVSLVIEESNFSTVNAASIQCDADLSVKNSRFVRCGHPDLDGGALMHTTTSFDTGLTVDGNEFAHCQGKQGGAIYVSYLKGLERCTFTACVSHGLADEKDISVFCESQTLGNPAVSACVFRQTSLYLAFVSDRCSGEPIFNSQFDQGNNYYSHGNYSEGRGMRSNTFQGGIEKQKFIRSATENIGAA